MWAKGRTSFLPAIRAIWLEYDFPAILLRAPSMPMAPCSASLMVMSRRQKNVHAGYPGNLENIGWNHFYVNFFPTLADCMYRNISKPGGRYRSKQTWLKETPMAINSISGTVYTSSSTGSQTTWTTQQLAQLQSYAQQHMSVNEIADKLNRPVAAIR